MNHLELAIHKESDSIIERLESHRLARSSVGPPKISKPIQWVANFFAVLCVASFAAMLVGIVLKYVQVAQHAGSAFLALLLLWMAAMLIAPVWPVMQELRRGSTPLTFARARASTNFRLVRDLAIRFDRRSLEATQRALEVERQLLERRKPLVVKLVGSGVLLVLVGRVGASGLEVRQVFDPIAWVGFIGRLPHTASGWLALVAATGAFWIVAHLQDAIDILQAHDTLLGAATQQSMSERVPVEDRLQRRAG